jgi:hypothetical protein
VCLLVRVFKGRKEGKQERSEEEVSIGDVG